MSDESDITQRTKIKRRDLLSTAAALPVAAALAPQALLAQERAAATARARAILSASASSAPAASSAPRTSRACAECRASRSSQSRTARSNRAAGPPRSTASRARTRTGQQLLAADGIDAVLIGTWPYMHREITLAALDSGRHVLCQARMANDAAEAREMLAASQRHSDLVTMLVPSSSGYSIDRAMLSLIGGDLLGEILSVDVQRLERGFADFGGELDWRHNWEFSGYNVLNVGAIYELMMRWLGPGNRVRGMTRVHVPTRRDEQGNERAARIPDHVEVLYELANGAPVHMKFSETTGLSRGNDTWIFGSEGTIHVDNAQKIFVGRRGDRELVEHPNPPEGQYRHRVEEEFINAIRGIEPVAMNTFEIGVRYMEWTEAIYRSAESGTAVSLPLAV